MSERRKDIFKGFLLMAGIGALSFMLLGADYPEHDSHPDLTVEIAVGIYKEFSSDCGNFQRAAAARPLWFLQCVVR